MSAGGAFWVPWPGGMWAKRRTERPMQTRLQAARKLSQRGMLALVKSVYA